MRTVVASLAALALAVPSSALAQPVSTMGGAGPDTYVEVHIGAYLPQSNDLPDLDPGIAAGGTFGARFNPNVSAEIELAYYRAKHEAPGLKFALDAVPLTASLRLRYPMKLAELSAFAGGGVHFAHVSSTSDLAGTHLEQSARDTAFGYHVGAEASFNLSPTMRVGFEARETFVTAKFDGVSTDIGGLRLAATAAWHF